MDGEETAQSQGWSPRVGDVLLAIFAFVLIIIAFEEIIGIPGDLTYRVGCAAAALALAYSFVREYSAERWVWFGMLGCLLANVAIFFSPLVDRPTSRGELLLFLLPNVIMLLVARIATYPVLNDHDRAMRQQMILGLVAALIFSALLILLALAEAR